MKIAGAGHEADTGFAAVQAAMKLTMTRPGLPQWFAAVQAAMKEAEGGGAASSANAAVQAAMKI